MTLLLLPVIHGWAKSALYTYTIYTLDYWLSWNCVPRCCYAGTWYIVRAWVHGLHMYTRWWNKKWSRESDDRFQNSKRSARGVFIKVSSSYILLLYTRITKILLYRYYIVQPPLITCVSYRPMSKWKELENLLRVIKRCTPIYVLYYIPISIIILRAYIDAIVFQWLLYIHIEKHLGFCVNLGIILLLRAVAIVLLSIYIY
jgi:hypothetical protein